MGVDLNLCVLFLLFCVSLTSTTAAASAAADANSSFLPLSPHFNLTMSASYDPTSGLPISSDLPIFQGGLLFPPFTVAIPTFHEGGLFFPILSSPSFYNSTDSSQPFGFSLGFYLIPNSLLNADTRSPCDTYGCNLYMAVCAGSSGNMSGSGNYNIANLTGALTTGLAPYIPLIIFDGYAVPVWFANEERPIRHADQASLIVKMVNGSKVLELRDGENVVWQQPNVDSMEMDDTGHLVLYNSSNLTVWQSSPNADTLAQGQMLTEGKDQLVSNDSSYGARMDQKGGLVLYMNKTHFNSREGQGLPPPYWVFPLNPSSAPCSNSPAYAKVDNDDIALYPGSCSSNASFLTSSPNYIGFSWMFWRLESDGMLYSYGVTSLGDASVFSVRRDPLYGFSYDGNNLLSLQWEDCNWPMACGPLGVCTPGAPTLCSCSSLGPNFEPKNETSLFQGCKRTLDLPSCTSFGKGSTTDFVQLNSTASILLLNEWTLNSTTPAVQLGACKQSCSSDCSCTGFFYQVNTSSCFFITDEITLLKVVDKNYTSFQDTTKLFAKDYVTFLKVASAGNKTSIAKTTSIPKASSRDALIIALSVIIPSALVCLVLGMAVYHFRARRNKYVHTNRLSKEESKELEDILPLLPSRYSYQDLFQATEGFNKLLGAGGCGSVYAGVLSDGRKVAVKVLQVVLQGTGHSKQFLAEIATIGRTGHHNIVRLVGFCWEVSQRLLVYEYVERGSLDRWIFVRESAALADDTSAATAVEAPFLDWKTRYSVALGIVRGLSYLHEDCEPPILHFDIKPQNILLDNDFVAKLADFGMSRLIERDMSAVVTGMRGTPGYIAPEWCSHGAVSKKSDVYSMGMVFLEIVGGRKNLDLSLLNNSDPKEQQAWHFPSWAARKCEQGQMMELVDRRLHGCGFDAAQALKLISIAFWCIQEDPATRPNASTIVQWLEGNSIVVEQPPFSVALNVRRSRPVNWFSSSIANSMTLH